MSRQPIDIRDPRSLHAVIGSALTETQRRRSELEQAAAAMAADGKDVDPTMILFRDLLRNDEAILIALAGVVETQVRQIQPANVVPLFPGRS